MCNNNKYNKYNKNSGLRRNNHVGGELLHLLLLVAVVLFGQAWFIIGGAAATAAHDAPLFHFCSSAGTSGGSGSGSSQPYGDAVAELVALLVQEGRRHGFYTASVPAPTPAPVPAVWRPQQQAYGLVACRGDLSTGACGECLSAVAAGIRRTCPLGVLSAYLQLDGCFLRYSDAPFFDHLGVSVWNSQPYHKSWRASYTLVIILGIIASTACLLLACITSVWIIRRRRRASAKEIGNKEEDLETAIESGPVPFTYQALTDATRNFAEENLLGKGGFGDVYKGILVDGRDIAVKRISGFSLQPMKDFLREVKLSSCVQHRNLVKLLGCCMENSQRILVYEYMHNRSLDVFLFGPECGAFLDWSIRRNIIIGVARGLTYLHEESQVRIIHRDIKLGNILLDVNLVPKIGDFGLAQDFDKDHQHTKVAGTIGYIPPECAMNAQLTEKVDIFSFGVLMLEVISGRRNKERTEPTERLYLLEWTWRLCEEGNLGEVIDKRLVEQGEKDEILMFVHVALLCTQEDAEMRPPISRILLMLCGVSDFLMGGHDDGSSSSSSLQDRLRRCASSQIKSSSTRAMDTSGGEASKNPLTISQLEPR